MWNFFLSPNFSSAKCKWSHPKQVKSMKAAKNWTCLNTLTSLGNTYMGPQHPTSQLTVYTAGKSIRYSTKMLVHFGGNFLKHDPNVLSSGLKIQPGRGKTQSGRPRGFSCLKQFLPHHPLWPWTRSASLGLTSAFLQPHKSVVSHCREVGLWWKGQRKA